jgi:3-oxoacyl-[acyl-carrier protein] reductase
MGSVVDFALADSDHMVAVNIRGFFVLVQEAVRHMSDGGRIISIGSVVADRSAFPDSSVYSMTKSAIDGGYLA